MADAEKQAGEEKPAAKDSKEAKEIKDEIVERTQRVTINGEVIEYTTTTGRLVMRTEEGKPRASIFFVAYARTGVEEVSRRPVTFSFNGGPGSSSVWMHLGLLGPRRVLSGDVETPQPPPYGLSDNQYSLLDVSDLVFIDPVSTGFSRASEGEDPKQFHSVEADVESVGDFIRLWVTRNKRWLSPKFLIGESYGTTRAAGLSGYLQERHGMYLNGIMLVSVVLDFQTLDHHPANDLPIILFLPTFAATAWYHGRLAPELQADLQATLREVESFAEGEFALALMRGDKLPATERAALAGKIARYTGLSADYVERANLRVEIWGFVKELLRAERRTVGRLDSRFTGADRHATGYEAEYDASYAMIQGAYTAAFNHYVRSELGFESDLPYEVLAGLYDKWGYDKHTNRYVSVSETLRAAMTKNPWLKINVSSGYFDLATPYFATEYTLHHLELEPGLRENVSVSYYAAGHMMYVHEPSLARQKADLAAFITRAVPKE